MIPVKVFMNRLLECFLRWTDGGRRWVMAICMYIVVSQGSLLLLFAFCIFLAPYVKNLSIWIRYPSSLDVYSSWLILVTIVRWLLLVVGYQLINMIVLFGCIRGCGYRVRFFPLWGRFLAGASGVSLMSVLVISVAVLILAALPSTGVFGFFMSLVIMFVVPIMLIYNLIWFTYQIYRLSVIHDMLTIPEVTDTYMSLREDITQEISGNISGASERQVTAVDTPIVSKLPVVLYFVAISGLWMLLSAVVDMWSRS